MKFLQVPASLIIAGSFTLVLFTSPAMAQTIVAGCPGSSKSLDSGSIKICFTSPADGSSLTGDVPVAVATNLANESTDIQSVAFTLNEVYLLTDYSSSYSFILPTEKWADGSYTILAVAKMRNSKTTALAQITVKFSNGNATAPVNPNHFTPSSGTSPASGQTFVVAAAGDGASGEDTSTRVIDTITSLNPNLFLYLGDVYESGSMAEFYNWYGTGSSNFSVLRAITDPTIGNHEYNNGVNGAGYFNYWDNIPNYYSFNAGGWHFISLNSNLAKLGGNPPGSAQYNWLAHDLTANAQTCTIAYYHEPLFNIGAEGPTEAMSSIWALLAQYKVAIVLNGHDHDYQRWVPLDGSGQFSPNGITEFVAGGGGHGLQNFVTTDNRVAYSNDLNPTAFGVLLLSLSQAGANFSYHSSSGSILDAGFIPCFSASSINSSMAGDSAPATPTMATLEVAPTSSTAPTAKSVVTDIPVPTATAVAMDIPASVATPGIIPTPVSAHKAPAFSGGIVLGSIAILLIVTGFIVINRRHG